MKTPEKAIVLAAGYGTRMIPLSLSRPKPMMPLWGRPIIEHIFETLKKWGVKEVMVNLHYQPDMLVRYVKQAESFGLKINFSFEPAILGTGGVLSRASWFLDDSPFWMINSDMVCDLNPRSLLKAFAGGKFLSVLWLNASSGPRTVEMKGNRITCFQSKRPGTEGTYTFCGLQLLSPRIVRYVPENGFSTIIQAYVRCMDKGHKIAGVCPSRAFWADMGTPDAYLDAHRATFERCTDKSSGAGFCGRAHAARIESLRKKGAKLSGFVSAGSGVKVEKGACIKNSILWDDVYIAAESIVENAIIADRVRVHGRVPQIAMRSDFCGSGGKQEQDAMTIIALNKLKWNPTETMVIPLEARGSAREFMRLEHEKQSVIMMRYSLERRENALYTRHAHFLKQTGWPVPSILLDVPKKQFAIIEDLGDDSLQRVMRATPLSRIIPAYQMTIAAVKKLHRQGTKRARETQLPMASSFSADLYRWEHEYFAHHFLEQRLKLPAKSRRAVLDELSQVSSVLQREREVLIHRDLQSSNIMLVRGMPFFIDFQGMRFGAAAYDLASLLCDPYVELPIRVQRRLLDLYNEKLAVRERISEETFWLAAVQRLAQVLGAFARLGANSRTAWYEQYISPGLRMIVMALQQSGSCPRLQRAMCEALNGQTCSRN